MHKMIFASRNNGKIKEVTKILEDSNFELLSLNDFDNIPNIVEDGETFEENARIKAETVYKQFSIPAIGDDSGIVVEQLDEKPGIYSARYAGGNATDDDNNKKLLMELRDFPHPHKAKFVCNAVYYDGKQYLTAIGEVKGKITDIPKGKNGFGYDPLFIPDGYSITMAELSLEEKNKISHRAKAFTLLKRLLLNRS